jgi:hypothetical protein
VRFLLGNPCLYIKNSPLSEFLTISVWMCSVFVNMDEINRFHRLLGVKSKFKNKNCGLKKNGALGEHKPRHTSLPLTKIRLAI